MHLRTLGNNWHDSEWGKPEKREVYLLFSGDHRDATAKIFDPAKGKYLKTFTTGDYQPSSEARARVDAFCEEENLVIIDRISIIEAIERGIVS